MLVRVSVCVCVFYFCFCCSFLWGGWGVGYRIKSVAADKRPPLGFMVLIGFRV